VSAQRRVRFHESFWLNAQAAFPPQRSDDGRPSIDDFRSGGVDAIRFEFERQNLLSAEPGSPIVVAILGAFLAMPPMVAYGVVDRDSSSGLATVDVYDLDVDWWVWEDLRRSVEDDGDS
jgi:hypothetical protein